MSKFKSFKQLEGEISSAEFGKSYEELSDDDKMFVDWAVHDLMSVQMEKNTRMKTKEILNELDDVINVASVLRTELLQGLHNGNVPVIAIAALQSSIDKLTELRIK